MDLHCLLVTISSWAFPDMHGYRAARDCHLAETSKVCHILQAVPGSDTCFDQCEVALEPPLACEDCTQAPFATNEANSLHSYGTLDLLSPFADNRVTQSPLFHIGHRFYFNYAAYLRSQTLTRLKGRGVFATHDIKPGEPIMTDRMAMKITKSQPRIQDHELQRAFNTLTPDQKARFLKLHEGHRPFQSKMMRVYKANAFGSGQLDNFLFLDISLLNHSCVPNAEMATEPREGEEMAIVAIKPIAKGEEVLICYQTTLHGMTARQRKNLLRTYWGFQCLCSVCTSGLWQSPLLFIPSTPAGSGGALVATALT